MILARLLGGLAVAIKFEAAISQVWQPGPFTTWQWQISNNIDTSVEVEMYDIDLFDASVEVIQDLKSKGIVVICYFSAGTREDWRDDYDLFPESVVGYELEDWPGEDWLDINNQRVRDIMAIRLDLALTKGCDGVEPDNVQVFVEGYDFSGLHVSAEDQLDFNIFLAQEAHDRGLSIGLKNDLPQLEDLEPYFDWALNEECIEYNNCEGYISTFFAAGKAVFNAEYNQGSLDFCDIAEENGLSSILKSLELGVALCNCLDESTNISCPALLEGEDVTPSPTPDISTPTPTGILTPGPTTPPPTNAFTTPAPVPTTPIGDEGNDESSGTSFRLGVLPGPMAWIFSAVLAIALTWPTVLW